MTATEKEKAGVLKTELCNQIANVLGTAVSKLDTEKPLTELGFDSLMAVELRNWAENNIGITLPTMEVMRGPSIVELTNSLLKAFNSKMTQDSHLLDKQKLDNAKTMESPKQIMESIEELSEDEMDVLLKKMLSQDNNQIE